MPCRCPLWLAAEPRRQLRVPPFGFAARFCRTTSSRVNGVGDRTSPRLATSPNLGAVESGRPAPRGWEDRKIQFGWGRQTGWVLVTSISSADKRDLRAAGSYRRAVWGYRAVLVGFVAIGLSVAVLALSLPSYVSMIGVGFAFAAAGAGVLLVWSSVLPMMRHQRKVLAKYGFSSAQRASTIGRLLWRDVVGSRQRR